MEPQQGLHLLTPERTVAPEDSILTHPAQVEAWVSALPMANLGETSRQLFKTIVEFNRLDIPPAERIKIAELFRHPIGQVTNGLRRHYFDANFPLSARNRKAAVLSRELYSELALAYKIFIEELQAGSASRLDRKLLIIAIHRAMRSLLTVLYQTAIVYDPYPRHCWQEIHNLYAYAEKRKFHEVLVKDDEEGGLSSTIENLYLQILLFSISGPYHLRQREIEYVFLQLSPWSKRVQWRQQRPQASSSRKNLFVARLDRDAPPLHITLLDENAGSNQRLLYTGRLTAALKAHYDDLPARQVAADTVTISGQAARHLLRKLIRVFRSAHKRKFARTTLNLELNNVVGLTRIHSMLSLGEPEPTPPAEEKTDSDAPAGTDWFIEPANTRPLINTLLYSSEKSGGYRLVPIGHEGKPRPEVIVDSEVDAPDFGTDFPAPSRGGKRPLENETFRVKTLNESAGGYCVHWHGKGAPGIKVGEVVGVQSASDSHKFSIGVSRWIKNTPGVGLYVGVEMVSPTSQSATIRLEEAGLLSDIRHKCLLLPGLEVARQPATLVLPALPFKPGDRALLKVGHEEQWVRLSRLLEITGSFSRFEFTAGEEAEVQEEEQTEEENETDFDGIWSDL